MLRKIPYQESPKRYEYILTQKGLDLYPIIMSIVHWGNVHMVDSRGRPMLHQHKNCGHMFDPVMVCSECGEPLAPNPCMCIRDRARGNRHRFMQRTLAPRQQRPPSRRSGLLVRPAGYSELAWGISPNCSHRVPVQR